MASRSIAAARPHEQTPQRTPDPIPDAVPKPKRKRVRAQRGSIVRRGDSFHAVYRTPEGKQKWATFRTRAEAVRHLTDSIQKIDAGRYVDARPALFEVYAEQWLARRQSRVKPATWRTYRSFFEKRLKPRFRGKEMREITSVDVRAFLDHLLQHTRLGGRSIRMAIILLRDLFNEAIDDRVAAANPVRLKKGDVPSNPKAKYVPTSADVLAVLAELDQHPALQALAAMAVMTGLRRGELLGLLWECVDWNAGTIRVERSLCRAALADRDKYPRIRIEWRCSETLALVDPKTKGSRRTVAMPQELAALLRNLRTRTRSASPYVFQDDSGAPFDPNIVHDELHAAEDRAGVRRFQLHALRHLYASELHRAGATLAHARDRLGHSNVGMTSHYTHDLGEGAGALAEKVALAFPLAVRLVLDVRARPS